ncbi:uncharacterized protein LOC136025472 [Artemia franciscana]|uniref:uncharacterized protein LOC136025472 n=1 Tax=Artemia franciscana TaxID=6661 RepID=UPI0032DAED91
MYNHLAVVIRLPDGTITRFVIPVCRGVRQGVLTSPVAFNNCILNAQSSAVPSSIKQFVLRNTVDEVLREEQCSLRKGRGCVVSIFTLALILEKCLSCQTPLVLSLMDYEQAYDSVGRRASGKVLSLYGILDKYINVISAMYENNTAAVKCVLSSLEVTTCDAEHGTLSVD